MDEWYEMSRDEQADFIMSIENFKKQAQKDKLRVQHKVERLLLEAVKQGKEPSKLIIRKYDMFALTDGKAVYGDKYYYKAGQLVFKMPSYLGSGGDGTAVYEPTRIE